MAVLVVRDAMVSDVCLCSSACVCVYGVCSTAVHGSARHDDAGCWTHLARARQPGVRHDVLQLKTLSPQAGCAHAAVAQPSAWALRVCERVSG